MFKSSALISLLSRRTQHHVQPKNHYSMQVSYSAARSLPVPVTHAVAGGEPQGIMGTAVCKQS